MHDKTIGKGGWRPDHPNSLPRRAGARRHPLREMLRVDVFFVFFSNRQGKATSAAVHCPQKRNRTVRFDCRAFAGVDARAP